MGHELIDSKQNCCLSENNESNRKQKFRLLSILLT